MRFLPFILCRDMKITDNTQSLKRNNDFRRVYRREKSEAGGFAAVYVLKNRLGSNRLGLTVGKTVGKAIVRSRVKRLLRECYRDWADKLPEGYDFIFVARSRAAGKSLEQLRKDVGYALKKLDMIK